LCDVARRAATHSLAAAYVGSVEGGAPRHGLITLAQVVYTWRRFIHAHSRLLCHITSPHTQLAAEARQQTVNIAETRVPACVNACTSSHEPRPSPHALQRPSLNGAAAAKLAPCVVVHHFSLCLVSPPASLLFITRSPNKQSDESASGVSYGEMFCCSPSYDCLSFARSHHSRTSRLNYVDRHAPQPHATRARIVKCDPTKHFDGPTRCTSLSRPLMRSSGVEMF
jgi:hypothetical protein